jgi:transcriptional regulator with XRE-family HTH domain
MCAGSMMSYMGVSQTILDLGVILREARKKRGWTQQMAADFSDLSEGWVWNVENGRCDPKLGDLLRFVEALGANLAEVISALQGRAMDGAGAGKVELEEDEETRRRTFLALLAGLPAVSVDRVADLERLAAPGLDAAYLRDAETVTRGLMEAQGRVSPAVLLPAASGHLSGLRSLMPGSRGLTSLVSRMAMLVGVLQGNLRRRGEAWTMYTLALATAAEAGDRSARSLALSGQYAMHSMVAQGPREGNPRRALELIEAALHPTTGQLRAVLLASRAQERAALGDTAGALIDIEAAETAMSRWRGEAPPFGARSPIELNAYRGNVELLVGRNREAVATLDATLAGMDPQLVSWRAAVLADQGAAHARMGELEAAVDRLERALQLARLAGDLSNEQRVQGVRHRDLAGRDDEPAVRRLDEQLLAG